MSTVTEKHKQVLEGKLSKKQFLQEIRKEFPQHITQFNGYEDSVRILKNRGLLYEETVKLEKQHYNLSPEAIRRGTDIELMNDGWDPADTSCVMEREKAEERAIKNLEKDPLYYLNKIAKVTEKPKTSADGLQKPGVDKEGAMKKATLKESTIKVLKDIYYSDKHGGFIAKDSIDPKYRDRGLELIYKKGTIVAKDIEYEDSEYLGILNSRNLERNEDYIVQEGAMKKATLKESNKVDKKRSTSGKPQIKSTIKGKTGNTQKTPLRENTHVDFKSWLESLYNVIMKNANLERSEISVDTQELQTYYKEGKSPEDVYFTTWMQDAGNFRALWEEKRIAIEESIKNVIKNIFSLSKPVINEHVTAPDNLAEFIDYQNEKNEDLAGRVREAAKKLSDHIYKIEKAYLDSRDGIEEIYASIGSYMAPSVAAAFRRDVEEVFKSYHNIALPKTKTLSAEDLEKLKQQGTTIEPLQEGLLTEEEIQDFFNFLERDPKAGSITTISYVAPLSMNKKFIDIDGQKKENPYYGKIYKISQFQFNYGETYAKRVQKLNPEHEFGQRKGVFEKVPGYNLIETGKNGLYIPIIPKSTKSAYVIVEGTSVKKINYEDLKPYMKEYTPSEPSTSEFRLLILDRVYKIAAGGNVWNNPNFVYADILKKKDLPQA